MTLSDIREILSERDLKLSKSLGQNFLHDQNQVRRIVAAAEAGPGDKILEIGPGLGPLTEALLQQGCEVLAIEKDQRLFDFLQQKFAGAARLQLLHDDALRLPENPPRLGRLEAGVQSALFGRLPHFGRTGPGRQPAGAHGRPPCKSKSPHASTAGAGSEHYGILGLLLQLRYQCAGWFKIPASCFFPGAGRGLRLRHPGPAARSAACRPNCTPLFDTLVKRGFSQRRKMMFKLLKQDWPEAPLRRGLPRNWPFPRKSAPKPSAWNNSSA